jgi:hypothetical protein
MVKECIRMKVQKIKREVDQVPKIKREVECWVCVCVNSTSGGGRSLATTAYQGRLALVSLPLGAAVNKIKSATLTLPSTQGRPLARLHPTFPRNCCSTDVWSRTKLQSLSSSSMIAGPAGPCTWRSKPLSFAKSKSIG